MLSDSLLVNLLVCSSASFSHDVVIELLKIGRLEIGDHTGSSLLLQAAAYSDLVISFVGANKAPGCSGQEKVKKKSTGMW